MILEIKISRFGQQAVKPAATEAILLSATQYKTVCRAPAGNNFETDAPRPAR